jgi:hypothetical protein
MQNLRVGRQTISQRAVRHQVTILMSIVLFIALSVVPSSVVQAQVECLGQCEAAFAGCIGQSGHIPAPICQDNYESCVNACLGSVAALLG